MKTKTIVCALLLTVVSAKITIAQSVHKEPKYYNWFDDHVKRFNTGLFNGVEYVELYRTINDKHKFFKSSEFQLGSVMYDGQFYDQVPLKYNLDTDQLLLNVGYNYPYPTLILFKSKIESFHIGGSDFIHIKEASGENDIQGFYEVLMKNSSLTVLKKNGTKRFKRIRGTTVYYEFISENDYVIRYNDTFHKIERKQDVVRIWPDKKEFINENYNQALKKNNEDVFWKNFFSKLSDSFKINNRPQDL